MDKIKTFPLVLTVDEHKEIQVAARRRGMSIKDFIKIAISNEMNVKVSVEKGDK